LRLITPTDPVGDAASVAERDTVSVGERDPATLAASPTETPRFYQLTHDYLVPSLRNWLTRKQKETRRGRAELLLADRATVWHGRPENRQLPSLWQWASIRFWTRKQDWTPPQRQMMRKTTRYHVVRAFLTAAALLVLGVASYEGFGRLRAHT